MRSFASFRYEYQNQSILLFGSVRLIDPVLPSKNDWNYGGETHWPLAGLRVLYMPAFVPWGLFWICCSWAWRILECFWTQIVKQLLATLALWPWLRARNREYHASFSQALTQAPAKWAPTQRCLAFTSPYLWERPRARRKEIYAFWTDPAGLQKASGLHFFHFYGQPLTERSHGVLRYIWPV